MKKSNSARTICYIICAVLMVALAVYQFMPFWTAGTDSVSLQGYLWFPENHKEVTNLFKAEVNPDFKVKDIVLMPLIELVIGLLGAFLCVTKTKKLWVVVCPLTCSIAGILGYLDPVMQLGAMWQVGLVLSIGIGVAAILPSIQCVQRIYKWFVPDKLQVEAR